MARAKLMKPVRKRRQRPARVEAEPEPEQVQVEPALVSDINDFDIDDFGGVSAPPPNDRLAALERVAQRFKAWRPAAEVLTRVRAVPTRFVQYDRATRVGGHPIERFMTVHGPSNNGKAQPLDEPVLTPGGWVEIGELKVGDRVIGADGRSTLVKGVFPQGVLPVFTVELSDGTFTRSCADHLWFTTTTKERNRGRYVRGPRPGRVRVATGEVGIGSAKTLAQVAVDFRPGDHALPIVGAVEFDQAGELLLDPYLMGLLLGDGGFTGSSVMFHKPEKDLRAAVQELVPEGDRCVEVNDVSLLIRGDHGSMTSKALKTYKLMGCRSECKFIPKPYVFASPSDRLALLRGLFDTDGHVIKEGTTVEYSTSSSELASDVAFVARSLGAVVRVSRRFPRYPYLGQVRDGLLSFRLMVSFPRDDLIPVASDKHLARWRLRKKEKLRTIEQIIPAGSAQCVCIQVESPDRLYVTRDFIVTHNTQWLIGLGLSFLERHHFFALVDAEYTTPEDWLVKMMDRYAKSPAFLALRPHTYEETVDAVRELLDGLLAARDAGEAHADTTALIVIDSLRKLVPEDILAKIKKHGAEGQSGSVDGMGGRAAQIKAAMNASWLDELTPKLYHCRAAMAVIARETEDPTATARDKQFGNDYKVTGGKSVIFDASLLVRVTRSEWVKEGTGDAARIVGERHRLTIRKTKVGSKEGKDVVCYFHTSNGVLIPEGFDRARDVLELARHYNLVSETGTWLSWAGHRWQGVTAAVRKLNERPEALVDLEGQVRARFAPDEALETEES